MRLWQNFRGSWRYLEMGGYIDGFLSDAEGDRLFLLARDYTPGQDAVVVELGSWQGKSSVIIAAGLRKKRGARLYCVDPFGVDEDPEYQQKYYDQRADRSQVELLFRRNVRSCGLEHIIVPMKGYSFERVREWSQPIDMLFIDANHEYEPVRRDFELWSPFIKPGGIIAFHDVGDMYPGPRRVVAEGLREPNYAQVTQVDSLVWARKL